MPHMCDVCGARPATVRLAVLRDGRRHVLNVCDFHYAQLTRHQRALSPFEALFMSDNPGQPDAAAQRVSPERETSAQGVGLERYLSDSAKEMLMRAPNAPCNSDVRKSIPSTFCTSLPITPSCSRC